MMFTDKNAREWNLQLNFGLIEAIKDKANVDLDDLLNKPDDFSKVLLAKPGTLVKILWVICESQAKSYGVSPTDFGYLFDRTTLDKAGDAFLEAMLDFYPRSSAGRVIRSKLPQLLKKMDDNIAKKVTKRLDDQLSNTDMN